MYWYDITEKPCKKFIKAYKWWLPGHCLWDTSVPQVGMEDDATAQLEYVIIVPEKVLVSPL